MAAGGDGGDIAGRNFFHVAGFEERTPVFSSSSSVLKMEFEDEDENDGEEN